MTSSWRTTRAPLVREGSHRSSCLSAPFADGWTVPFAVCTPREGQTAKGTSRRPKKDGTNRDVPWVFVTDGFRPVNRARELDDGGLGGVEEASGAEDGG